MSEEKTHPSFLVLDRFAVGGDVPTAIRVHIGTCPHCLDHVQRVQQACPVPEWVRPLDQKKRRCWFADPRVWAGGFVSLGVAAAAILLTTRETEPSRHASTTTVRGAPAVGVYIKRENHIALWDGHEALVPDDRIRIRVVPDEFRYVAVFTVESMGTGRGGRFRSLYSSTIVRGKETMLPRAWKVDADPGVETLIVVLSNHRLQSAEVLRSGQDRSEEGLWVRWFHFPKQVQPDRDVSRSVSPVSKDKSK